MFLDTTIRRNPGLIRAAVELHQSGELPHIPTYVIDLDAVRHNARATATEAKRLKLQLYFMSKQFGRNPLVSKAIINSGIPKAVAVEAQGAKTLRRFGIPIGHAGHLVQIPKFEIETILEMEPEVVTVFDIEKAKQISKVATKRKMSQKLLLRVQDIARGDIEIPAEQGGFKEDEVVPAAKAIGELDGVTVAGLTSFPCASFNEETKTVETTTNLDRIVRLASRLRKELHLEVEQINAPWPTSTNMLRLIAEKGGTHAEPGHGLMGTTPWHIFADLPEIPAWVYVTEVSHVFDEYAMVYGGGMGIGVDYPTFMFGCPKFMSTYKMHALVGSDPDTIMRPENKAIAEQYGPQFTDYYSMLRPRSVSAVKDGDTAIYGFRPQIFVTRAQVAIVEGIRQKRLRVLGIFDRAANLIDKSGKPLPDAKVLEMMKDV